MPPRGAGAVPGDPGPTQIGAQTILGAAPRQSGPPRRLAAAWREFGCRRLIVPLLAALICSGCALFKPEPKDDTAKPSGPPPVALDIEAPAELKALLEKNLDLARLGSVAPGERIESLELARLIAATPGQARSLLETEGYFSSEVQATRETDTPADTPADAPPRVRVRVLPGPQARVDRLDLEVQGDIETSGSAGNARARAVIDALRKDWPLKPGTPFRNGAWSSAKSAALAKLRAEGYASATMSGTSAQVDAQQHTVRLFVVADSGPLYRTGELKIEGLVHHDAQTVRNLAGFSPGTPASESLLLDYQERLQQSGLFDRAAVTLDPDVSTSAAAPVTVRVGEQKLHQATVGLGISADTGPRTTLEYSNRRVFGRAATARFKLGLARDEQTFDSEISTHPRERFYRYLVGATAAREDSGTDIVSSISARIGRAQETPRIDRLVFLQVERAIVRNDLFREQADAVSGNYQVVYRKLDNMLLPTRGYSLSVQTGLGYATSNLGRSGPFTRLYGRLTGYRPFGKWYGTGRVELGQVIHRNGVTVPDTLQFRAGGDGSVRGYAYRSLSPTIDDIEVGGDVLFTTSVEIARPISSKYPLIWWALFADAGNADDSWHELSPVVGVGAGLRIRSPVGPLSIDLAYGEAVKRFRLHLSVGVTF
jgi:translocation and assembly module TamA